MSKKPPFVLVHGAWHGAWCWERLAPRLRAAGHETYTPTLAGAGERVEELRDGIDVSTHVGEVAELFEEQDLRDAVLVGHSYGGLVITGVADRVPARVGRLVYLDAFFPEDGKSFRDYCDGQLWGAIEKGRSTAEPWRSSFPFPVEILGVEDPGDREWIGSRLGDFPYPALREPVRLSGREAGPRPLSYILTSELHVFVEASDRAERAGARVERLSGGHDAMVTDPEPLSTLLLELGA